MKWNSLRWFPVLGKQSNNKIFFRLIFLLHLRFDVFANMFCVCTFFFSVCTEKERRTYTTQFTFTRLWVYLFIIFFIILCVRFLLLSSSSSLVFKIEHLPDIELPRHIVFWYCLLSRWNLCSMKGTLRVFFLALSRVQLS